MNDSNALDLADLRQAWTQLDQRVDTDLAKMASVTEALAQDHTRTLVQRAIWPPATDLALAGAAWLVCVTGFSQPGSAVYFTCLWTVLAVLTALVVSSLGQIVMLAKLDAAAPVVATQRQLERVRALRIFEWKWVLLLSPTLWWPFLVVCVELPLKLLLEPGIVVFGWRMLIAQVLIGAAISAALWWLSSWLGKRLRATSFLRSLLDDLAGRRLTAARGFLARLDGFEREEQ